MSIPPSELVRWVRRYEAADRRIAEERRGRRMDPDDALRRALDLSLLVEELNPARGGPDPTAEDMEAYRTWARLRRPKADPT